MNKRTILLLILLFSSTQFRCEETVQDDNLSDSADFVKDIADENENKEFQAVLDSYTIKEFKNKLHKKMPAKKVRRLRKWITVCAQALTTVVTSIMTIVHIFKSNKEVS